MMSLDLRLLQTLADGNFHSGEELGQLLGVSRAAIWKQLQKLEEFVDLQLESIKGKGYRLRGGIELLDAELIIPVVSEPAKLLLHSLNIIEQVDSTNRLAIELAQKGASRGCVVLAEQQTAGKGRRGRLWVSPFARNIYCSVIWEFDAGAAALEGLSLAVGVAVAQALEVTDIHGVELKWPNDIVYEQRKLAGILIEMMGDASGRCQVVIGVGINIAMSDSIDASAIDQPWTDTNTIAGTIISRNQLTANLITQLLPLLAEFEAEGFASFQDAWSMLDCTKGKPIAIHFGERTLLGTAAGINVSGALAIDTETGRQWFHGGEVSLRLQN
jgi:BirA family biotin operon repressor/biotin-[acetyl-CoA-carboxylase] ligase